jgi:AcrR family transcriptional regulator
MTVLTFKLNEHLYLRDPQHTQLGQKIIHHSIELIDKLGFEQFTFKKLAIAISSTEASIYRYFENKHRLLLYLISWYWNWLEYRMEILASPFAIPADRLKTCIHVLAEEKKYDPTFEFVNEEALHRIVIAELDKTYLTKGVDDLNREGLFGGLKAICKKIAVIISEINPIYPFANALATTVLIAAHQQLFFIDHLPSLSNIEANGDRHKEIYHFLENLIFRTIQA